jgi:predicted esterase
MSVKNNVHEGQPLLIQGAPLGEATRAMIFLHGRGASAEDIMQLSDEFKDPHMAYLAPQAEANSWYPNRFLMETRFNEPWLSSALAVVSGVIQRCLDSGLSRANIYLAGFSQGACLALEYAARNPARYGGVFGFSGALIGGENEERPATTGSLQETPVFLGCSNTDPHIPAIRVRESAQALKALGGNVTLKLYPLMGHTINDDELTLVRAMMGPNHATTEKAS